MQQQNLIPQKYKTLAINIRRWNWKEKVCKHLNNWNWKYSKLMERSNPILCRKHDESVVLKMWWPVFIAIHNVQV
jgi:hypothetical protein